MFGALHTITRLIGTIVVVATVGACAGEPSGPRTAGDLRRLPPPDTEGQATLEETMAARRSVRSFIPEALTEGQIGQLLWAGQGVTAEWGGRAAPSAGALYPLELYAVTEDGVYHYRPDDHALVRTGDTDVRDALTAAAFDQEAVGAAPAIVVIAAEFDRTEVEYGNRAERYVHMEAGHAAQNMLLQAVSLGLGAVPIGAFHDTDVQEVLDLPAEYAPLYLLPVGIPAE